MSLKEKAGKLRAIAAELEQTDANAPQSASELLRREGPQPVHVENCVDLFALGGRDYNARNHLCTQAGQQIGHHLASKLDYDLANGRMGMQEMPDLRYGQAWFKATIYALTPGEIEKLLQRAWSLGRDSR